MMNLAVVLLVDDEVPFVETMTKRLSKRNLSVLSANSGQAALQVLDKDKTVDVVVLDVKMPGMDGIDALREIKKLHPLVEVVMLTGHATVESAIEGMKLGAFDYLMKPCDIDQLLAKVQEAKTKKNAHEEKIVQARIKEITLRHGG
jgi:DNA-binding NtrC family response regulator